jgi:hypothetical protein
MKQVSLKCSKSQSIKKSLRKLFIEDYPSKSSIWAGNPALVGGSYLRKMGCE